TRFSRDWSSDVCSSDLLVADHPVGNIAAEDGAGVDQGQVGAVGAAGIGLAGGITAEELGDDVERQGPAHAVEGEALPEFRHEQRSEERRVGKEGRSGWS